MGCCGSSQANGPTPEAARRRLSVGHVDKDGSETNDAINDDDRGLIKQLNDENIIEMLKDTGDRKFSIGSDQDDGKTSFANKKAVNEGDKIEEATSGLGYTCRK